MNDLRDLYSNNKESNNNLNNKNDNDNSSYVNLHDDKISDNNNSYVNPYESKVPEDNLNLNNYINDNSTYVNPYDSKVPENNLDLNNYIEDHNSVNSSNIDDEMLKAFLGPDYDNMIDNLRNGGINIYAIFFGLQYFAYRKMYLVCFLILIISVISNFFIRGFASFIGNFIGFAFYPIYKMDIERKLEQIKSNNPNASSKELISLAAQEGGTSYSFLLFIFLIYLLLFFFFYNYLTIV